MEKTGNRRSFLKTAILLAMASLLGVCLAACATENNDKTLKELVDYIASKGLNVTQVGLLKAEAASADAGISVKIDSREVGIYKFDTSKKKQKERLQRIVDHGFIGVAGHKFGSDNMAVNGTFVLIDYKTHPQGAKILEAFKDF